MHLMNTAIDHFILHEMSALRAEEQRLNAELAGAQTDVPAERFMRAIAEIEARIENLDSVLDQLELPTAAFSGFKLHAA